MLGRLSGFVESDFFDLYQPNRNAIQQMLEVQRQEIIDKDASATGFNIGINACASVAQTVFRCHIRLMPRRDCDVDNPIGGVRGVIAGKQQY